MKNENKGDKKINLNALGKINPILPCFWLETMDKTVYVLLLSKLMIKY